MKLDLEPDPFYLDVGAIGYAAQCRARGCNRAATSVPRKSDRLGRPLGQIELCDHHTEIAIARERARGLTIRDERLGN
jgi:hypothetical protein